MTRGQRSALLLAVAVAGGLALSGAIAFRPVSAASTRPRSRTSSSDPDAIGEGSLTDPFGMGELANLVRARSRVAPSPVAAPRGASLDAQYVDSAGRKLSMLVQKKPASGIGPDGVANRTRGAGTGSALQLDG